MCFSAPASFSAAAVIAGVGVVAAVQKKPSSHRMLAAVPLVFAAQQVTEGIVWLTIGRPAERTENLVAVAVFMAVALVVWPVWVPLSLMLAEKNPRRRRVVAALTWFGGGAAAFAARFTRRHRASPRRGRPRCDLAPSARAQRLRPRRAAFRTAKPAERHRMWVLRVDHRSIEGVVPAQAGRDPRS
jgi:hypothetical protein